MLRKILFTLFFFVIQLLALSSGSISQINVHAACNLSYAFAMTSQNGQYTLLFFNDPRASQPNPPTYSGRIFANGAQIQTTTTTIDASISTTYSIAKVQQTTSLHTIEYQDLPSFESCGTVNVNPIPYDPAKDPYPKDKHFEIYIDTTSNTYKCRETTNVNAPYATLQECETAAKAMPPIMGSGIPKPGSKVTGENPCKPAASPVCKTGIGDIPTSPQGFVTKFLTIAIGLGGGIAFILMVIGAIRVLTSSGDQQKLAGGRDQMVAAIAGLLFIIFSTVILRFIGISVLGL